MESTASRVPAHTARQVNRQIRRRTEANIEYYKLIPRKSTSASVSSTANGI